MPPTSSHLPSISTSKISRSTCDVGLHTLSTKWIDEDGNSPLFGGVFWCIMVSYAFFLRYSILICLTLAEQVLPLGRAEALVPGADLAPLTWARPYATARQLSRCSKTDVPPSLAPFVPKLARQASSTDRAH
jgi:hypothetical protein